VGAEEDFGEDVNGWGGSFWETEDGVRGGRNLEAVESEVVTAN